MIKVKEVNISKKCMEAMTCDILSVVLFFVVKIIMTITKKPMMRVIWQIDDDFDVNLPVFVCRGMLQPHVWISSVL